MPHLDIFAANSRGAFSQVQLTAVLLDQPHVPMRLGQMGLFEANGISTTSLSIERQNQTLQLVPTSPRGGTAHQRRRDARQLIQVPSVRIAEEAAITADEIQNVRALGSETELMTVQDIVNDRNRGMSQDIEATLEFQRIGALKGLILDSDGSTLLDLFSIFGVSAQTEVDFDLDNANPADGALRTQCSAVIRTIEDALDGLSYTGIHAMCSSQFFDAFVAHPEYRAMRLATPQAELLGSRAARGQMIQFGGITWEEYRGAVGGQKYVADHKAHIFPVGVPGLFITRYAPAEWWRFVNTRGLPRYARITPDPQDPDSQVIARVQSHPVNLCTRPNTMVPARRT